MNAERDLSSASSNYADLYKYNGVLDGQSGRRAKKLEELKKRRNDAVDELRNITDIFHDDETMEVQTEAIPLRKKSRRKFTVRVMMSEWMVDVPADLEETWYYKVCPKGVRNLVVACGGLTKVYNRRNQVKGVFYSPLPGGGAEGDGASNSRITLLDCVYRNQDRTFYVLDILAWNSMSLLNCSAEFRFYFIESKLSENPRLLGGTKKFKPVYHKYATRANISDTFSDVYCSEDDNTELPIDGILFFHKDSVYTAGLTPLVGWLKPYMLPEKLDIVVHTSHLLQKPSSYTNLEDYLSNKVGKKKAVFQSKSGDHMDYCQEVDEETNHMEG